MDQEVNAVVVGSSIGVLLHLPALRGAGFTVPAIVGRDPHKAAHRARLLGVPHSFTSLTEALAFADIDVVVVATPPHSHGPLVFEALEAGKHVLCEKPFAKDASEARAMLAAARDAGVVHALGTEFRFDSPQALLNRVVRAGTVGTPRLAVEFLQVPTLATPTARTPAWFDDAEAGGGWFGGSSPHILDRVRSILGEFTSVSASIQRLGPRPGVTADDTYTIMFTLDSGVEGIIHSSAAVGGPSIVSTKVTGTEGTAWIDSRAAAVFVDRGSGAEEVSFPEDLAALPAVPPLAELLTTTYDMWHSTGEQVIPYLRLYRNMRDRILGLPLSPDPVLPTFEDGFRLQVLMDIIQRAAAENRTVMVDQERP